MTVYHIGRRLRGSIFRVLRTQDTTDEFIKDQFKFIYDPKRVSFAKFLREIRAVTSWAFNKVHNFFF